MDNGAEYTNSALVEYCNSLQIHRELTVPYTPQQNGPVESGLSRAIKAGHAARIEVDRLFPDVHLERLKGVRDPDGTSLWMESVLWASEGFNRSATTANSACSPRTRYFTGAARRCRSRRSASRHTITSRGRANQTGRRARAIS